jgi:hypothetical protein
MIRPRPGADVTNHYLLAVLNHPLSEAFVRTHTSSFRGGYYSHSKQFIKNLPIPVPGDAERTSIEAMVGELMVLLDTVGTATTPHRRTQLERQSEELRTQIEQSVSSLFGLSSADVATAQAVPVPT